VWVGVGGCGCVWVCVGVCGCVGVGCVGWGVGCVGVGCGGWGVGGWVFSPIFFFGVIFSRESLLKGKGQYS
jgi:hypothetical protein